MKIVLVFGLQSSFSVFIFVLRVCQESASWLETGVFFEAALFPPLGLTPAASASACVVRLQVGGEVEVGLALDSLWTCSGLQFQFKWKQTVGTLYIVRYLCILRHSFSLFASVMLRDFRVYLKIQMDGGVDTASTPYVTVDAARILYRVYIRRVICGIV